MRRTDLISRLMRELKPLEFCTILFYAGLSLTNVVFASRVEQWYLLVIVNVLICSGVAWIGHYGNSHKTNFARILRYTYPMPLIFITFKEIYLMVKPIRGADFDWLLISVDKFLFGVNPTQVLYKISNPVLTELLQIDYALFYVIPITLIISLFMQQKFEEADYSVFSVVFGFYLSYIGYFALPAIGPRFTLHDFSQTNAELPGLIVTNFLRELINSGESIPQGTINPAAIVQRDVFPSGHTMMTLIVMYLSVHYKDRTRYILLPVGVLLIFATVYLRYHYVIDLIAGSLCMMLSLWLGKRVYGYIVGRHEKQA